MNENDVDRMEAFEFEQNHMLDQDCLPVPDEWALSVSAWLARLREEDAAREAQRKIKLAARPQERV